MSSIITNATIKHRRDTAGNWTSNNPTPGQGEWCLETDTGFVKIGDGSTEWNSLGYIYDGTGATLATYSTGWVSNSDWTNAQLAINHDLGEDLSNLIVKFFISTDGTEANSFEINQFEGNAAATTGVTYFNTDSNNITIQTGTNGIYYINSSGSGVLIDTESWYYKVKVYKLT